MDSETNLSGRLELQERATTTERASGSRSPHKHDTSISPVSLIDLSEKHSVECVLLHDMGGERQRERGREEGGRERDEEEVVLGRESEGREGGRERRMKKEVVLGRESGSAGEAPAAC